MRELNKKDAKLAILCTNRNIHVTKLSVPTVNLFTVKLKNISVFIKFVLDVHNIKILKNHENTYVTFNQIK